jgi:energy-coupling factor transport system ATP-binding protein
MTAIAFEHFCYAYPGGEKVLQDISLTVKQGSFTVITGPGGAGKTTLCLAAAGVVPHYFGGATAGAVRVNGIHTMERSLGELARQVALVLEDYESQLVAMTVEEEVAFGLENAGVSRSEIPERVCKALAMVGLAGREQCEVSALSGGQKQRLALAGALVIEPDILVLDEPASALDPEGAAGLYELLGQLNRGGMTVIVVEHDIARILPYADQLVLLLEGRIAITGAPAAVLTTMGQENLFAEALPALWELRLRLAASGCRFGNWRDEADAIRELTAALTDRRGEIRSA